MFPLSRLGDVNEVGGQIMRGAVGPNSVLCNGKPIGLHPSPISPHPKKHILEVTTSASLDVYCQGSPVLRVTSGNSCFHSIVTGSKDVYVS